MYDCNSQISKYQKEHVTLNPDQQGKMRSRRNANRQRVKNGLIKNNNPVYMGTVSQGSYAMHTMTQDQNNDYDIDDGQLFNEDDLVGKQGTEMSPLDARKMVRDAADDGSFKNAPEVLKNCVRVHYNDGSHVDIPVYKKLSDGTLELASSSWKGSSPTDVTDWYKDSVLNLSVDQGAQGGQLRRITRLLKAFMRSRGSWKKQMPSGFCISVLVVENYVGDTDREDVSLYETMKAIRDRLSYNKVVMHPTRLGESLTKSDEDCDVLFLYEKMKWALDKLEVLQDSDCSEVDALKAWNCVFDHKYFANLIKEAEEKKETISNALRTGNEKVTLGAGLGGIAAPSIVSAVDKGLQESVKTTRAFSGKNETQ